MKSPMFISLKPVQMKIEFGEFLELLRTLVIDILVRMPAMHRTRFINSGVSNPELTMGALALGLAQCSNAILQRVGQNFKLSGTALLNRWLRYFHSRHDEIYLYRGINIVSDLLSLVDLFLGSDDETGRGGEETIQEENDETKTVN